MLKLPVKPIILTAAFALSLTAGMSRASAVEMNEMENVPASFSDAGNGIVLKEVSDVDSKYCHIKYMAFTEHGLKSGDLEFNPTDVIDRYGDCSFNPKETDEVKKQVALMNRSAGDGSNDSDSGD